MEKKTHQVMTRSIEEEFKTEEWLTLKACFDMLKKRFPKEYHFVIRFSSANQGEGKDVWYIIDEGEEERVETMLFPKDY